ncbi:hypothetical protein F5X96DRAFT_690651 [Biscogniauxia mediterranea]|nr:hypothetical protein F5X96DRAFT_690651 [Biscogniauxia mediterranea]
MAVEAVKQLLPNGQFDLELRNMSFTGPVARPHTEWLSIRVRTLWKLPKCIAKSVKALDCLLYGYRTLVRARAFQVVKIPDTMSFTDAAAIPTAFCTAYPSLCNVSRLQKGESILIHSAAGGTG